MRSRRRGTTTRIVSRADSATSPRTLRVAPHRPASPRTLRVAPDCAASPRTSAPSHRLALASPRTAVSNRITTAARRITACRVAGRGTAVSVRRAWSVRDDDTRCCLAAATSACAARARSVSWGHRAKFFLHVVQISSKRRSQSTVDAFLISFYRFMVGDCGIK